MQLLDFVALFLAVGAVVDVWLREGGLFEDFRDLIQTWGTSVDTTDARRETPWRRWYHWAREKLGQLAGCNFCLSYHAAFWLLALFYVPSLFIVSPWNVVIKLPIYLLAATRLSLAFDSIMDTVEPKDSLDDQ